MPSPKSERLTLRLTTVQKDLITQAAAAADVTLTEFVTATASARAHAVLNSETTMRLDAQQGLKVAEALLNPGEPNTALRDLLGRPSPT